MLHILKKTNNICVIAFCNCPKFSLYVGIHKIKGFIIDITNTNNMKFFIGSYSNVEVSNTVFLKEVSYAHQGSIRAIKNTVIFLNIITN